MRGWGVEGWEQHGEGEQLPHLLRPGAPDIFQWWDAISAKRQHAPSFGMCSISGEFYDRRRNRGGVWWGADADPAKNPKRIPVLWEDAGRAQSSALDTVGLVCSTQMLLTLWGQKRGCMWTITSIGLIEQSSEHPSSHSPICPSVHLSIRLLILLTLFFHSVAF